MHWEILNKNQKPLLGKLVIFRKIGAYLAGGTALALHLGHRSSEDFDFYVPKEFNSETFESAIRRSLPGFARNQIAY
ncbi:MAG: nucleotidyl transferase AbiEii/AbiGii toxin family protein, partial [Deltaproteobacteria bacterium]|nr:nucleotidyl transferase AbiEii/AbiGii toxin family protein [Deltaproteobacteria bacterium]